MGAWLRMKLWTRSSIMLLALVTISLFLWSHIWFAPHPTQMMTCNCGDPVEQVWWFGWFPFSFSHWINPLHSQFLFAGNGGISATNNTSWITLALALSPVTAIWGPITSSNLSNLLAPILSGMAMWWFLRRLTRYDLVSAGGALAYAYMPFVMRNAMLSHVNLTVLAYLPLVMAWAHDLLTHRRSPRWVVTAIGLATVAQFMLGQEVFVIDLFVMGAIAVVWFIRERLQKRPLHWPLDLRTAAWAIALPTVLLIYPVYLYFYGPQHVQGPFWGPTRLALRNLVTIQSGALAKSGELSAVGYGGPQGPGVDYIGWGLFALSLATLPWWWRRTVALGSATAALIVLRLGVINSHQWAALPIVSSIVQARFVIVIYFALIVTIVCGLDAILHRYGTTIFRRSLLSVALLTASVVAVFPIYNSLRVPYTVVPVSIPAWFTHEDLPSSSVVVVFPATWSVSDQVMTWQAESGYRFHLVSGFGFIPGSDQVHDEFQSATHFLINELEKIQTGRLTVANHPQFFSSMRSRLIHFGVNDVVAIDAATPARVMSELIGALGPATSTANGAHLWVLTGPR